MRIWRQSLVALWFVLTIGGWAQPIHLLVTGDMHGWLQGQQVDGQMLGGAAEMMSCWQQIEHYQPHKDFLLLSCGDNVTGPALATIFKGEPVIEVMNQMGYDVSVLGNHEFDYGRAQYDKWVKQAKFRFIVANLVKADGTPSDMALPYVICDNNGVKVGIIGLITAAVAKIASTDGQTTTPYAATLRKYVPEMRAQGAQVIVVLAHVPMNELETLARQVKDLHIPLMLGGHSHELHQIQVADTQTWVVNSGCWWRAYSRIDLDYQAHTGNAVVQSCKQVWMQQEQAQANSEVQQSINNWQSRMGLSKPIIQAGLGVQEIINRWQMRMGAEYGVELGYTASGITRPLTVVNFIGACYLGTDPGADVTLFNNGGFRQDITPGGITKGVIVGVMPFTNQLYRITVSGQQLLDYHAPESSLYYGLRREDTQLVLMKTGQPIDPHASYHLLITDYLYQNSPYLLAADPHPVIAAADYRQPVYDWLARHPSNNTRALETIIDLKAPVLAVGKHLAEHAPAH